MPEVLRVGDYILVRDTDTMFWYMIEEVDLDPNGKLFESKLEEGNGGLGNRKIIMVERAGRSPRDEETKRGEVLRINI